MVINDIVYAELSVGHGRFQDVDVLMAPMGIPMSAIPRRGLFPAGKAFQRYRRLRGTGTGVLVDLFIGAHAVVTGSCFVTRDPGRYLRYFPDLRYFPGIELIAPSLN